MSQDDRISVYPSISKNLLCMAVLFYMADFGWQVLLLSNLQNKSFESEISKHSINLVKIERLECNAWSKLTPINKAYENLGHPHYSTVHKYKVYFPENAKVFSIILELTCVLELGRWQHLSSWFHEKCEESIIHWPHNLYKLVNKYFQTTFFAAL